MPELQLHVGGRRYSGWKEIRVGRGIERAAADFDIGFSERWEGQAQPWPIAAGSPCEIRIDGALVITGHVDTFRCSLGSSEHALA